ncbi:hypothetical protein DLM_1366 [Aquitalea magnusonii]|uniref:Uncharacterized protein n=1 Tax=Aquitalea magnusonii TaxID=332411 RepID=A0A3G9GAR2_9NEIS|nr:hypothetical protein DLM_1366 [Aquitalea magnusonii]
MLSQLTQRLCQPVYLSVKASNGGLWRYMAGNVRGQMSMVLHRSEAVLH